MLLNDHSMNAHLIEPQDNNANITNMIWLLEKKKKL